MAGDPRSILDEAFRRAVAADGPLVQDADIAEKIAAIATNLTNRALIRLLLAAALAKINRPEIDIRKPYTEIGTEDAYSGRYYDEQFIAEFVQQHNLPCNPTTAFLTPALQNIGSTLSRSYDCRQTQRTVQEDPRATGHGISRPPVTSRFAC